MSFICHIHNYTEYNEEWNVFSTFNPSKCTHLEQWAADCAAPGEQSWTSCRSRDSNPQLWVTSGFKSNALSNTLSTKEAVVPPSSFLAGGMNFPPPSRMLNPWQFSSDTLKLISYIITWLHLKIKKHILHSLSLTLALFPLTSHCLAIILASL